MYNIICSLPAPVRRVEVYIDNYVYGHGICMLLCIIRTQRGNAILGLILPRQRSHARDRIIYSSATTAFERVVVRKKERREPSKPQPPLFSLVADNNTRKFHSYTHGFQLRAIRATAAFPHHPRCVEHHGELHCVVGHLRGFEKSVADVPHGSVPLAHVAAVVLIDNSLPLRLDLGGHRGDVGEIERLGDPNVERFPVDDVRVWELPTAVDHEPA